MKKYFLIFLFCFITGLSYTQDYSSGECYKHVYSFYETRFNETSVDFKEYNDILNNILANYTPTKDEINHCLLLSLYSDDSFLWVEKFHQMGGDLKGGITIPLYFGNLTAKKNFEYVLNNIDTVYDRSSDILSFLTVRYFFNIDIWSQLVQKGLDLNAKENGYSVIAGINNEIVNSDIEFIQFLVNNGYDIFSENERGDSLISAVIWSRNTEIKKYLLSFSKKQLWNGFLEGMNTAEVIAKVNRELDPINIDIRVNDDGLYISDYVYDDVGGGLTYDRPYTTRILVTTANDLYMQRDYSNSIVNNQLIFYFFDSKLIHISILFNSAGDELVNYINSNFGLPIEVIKNEKGSWKWNEYIWKYNDSGNLIRFNNMWNKEKKQTSYTHFYNPRNLEEYLDEQRRKARLNFDTAFPF